MRGSGPRCVLTVCAPSCAAICTIIIIIIIITIIIIIIITITIVTYHVDILESCQISVDILAQALCAVRGCI